MADPWGYGSQSQSGYNFGSYVPLQQQQRQQQQQSGRMPQINPMQFINQGGQGGGLFGGGAAMTPTATAQASGTVGAHAAPYAGAGSSAAGGYGGGFFSGMFGGGASGAGGASSLMSFWPAAVVAAAIANENYQGNIGNRDNEAFTGEYALTGRAFNKDAKGWGDKADGVLPGLGSGVRIAGNLSSPVDLFRGDTYRDLWKDLKNGGTVGSVLKELF